MGIDDASGHTTYGIVQPLIEGDGKGASSTIASVTGTLVEGSNYVSFTDAISTDGFGLTLGGDFTVQSGNAIATGLDTKSHATTAPIPIASFALWVLDLPASGWETKFSAEKNSGELRHVGGLGSGLSVGLNGPGEGEGIKLALGFFV
ncbi:hypothetical protein FB451DRAFT_1181366 [Mycena latifolia]|nr:hypothetical protein FB451DRAFT_1181366 [Mycena latifolia]